MNILRMDVFDVSSTQKNRDRLRRTNPFVQAFRGVWSILFLTSIMFGSSSCSNVNSLAPAHRHNHTRSLSRKKAGRHGHVGASLCVCVSVWVLSLCACALEHGAAL
jgi:hypothetical protein